MVSVPGGARSLGATVEVTAGSAQRLQARTDTNGRYGGAGQVQMRVSAEGFASQVLNLVVVGHGATHAFEFTLLEPMADVTGIWTMTIAPSPIG